MTALPPNRNYAFAEALIDELGRAGLRNACICPGSRSTPLVLTFAKNRSIKTWVHLDERSAAFFALGMARCTRRPVALVCTSGTAAANFLPAVVEARYAHAPLLLLTADRPPEAWDWGANQTIDQTRLYGSHVKWSVNLAPSEINEQLLRHVRAMACRAMITASSPPAGPVHLNIPLREPLTPEEIPQDLQALGKLPEENSWRGREDSQPFLSGPESRLSASQERLKSLSSALRESKRGLLLCGPQSDPGFPEAVSQMATRLGFPLLADPLSQLRCGCHDRSFIVDRYDSFLRHRKLAEMLSPDLILRFGPSPSSQALLNFLQRHEKARQIVVSDGEWFDPIHTASDFFFADPTSLALELTSCVPQSPMGPWAELWLRTNRAAGEAITQQLNNLNELFEGKVFSELSSIIPGEGAVFVGNSMPVRDLDSFWHPSEKKVQFLGNRGASGIDGVVSTGLGFSALLPEPLVLVVGDLSFYHDMNGLFAAKENRLKATIVVLNNNGGGIFSFLPQKNYPEYFETCFGTPHNLNFAAVAELYGLEYRAVTSWEEFRSSVTRSIGTPGTDIIEVKTERNRNVELHRLVWSAALRSAEDLLRTATSGP